MNTPTPEQLQEFIEWYCNKFAPLQSFDLSQEDWEKEYRIMNDYVTHVLTKHEGFQSNAELKRKLAALQEQNTNLLGKLATTEQNLAISQERLKAEQDYSMMMKEQFESVHTQLTVARKEIEGLKERMTRARSILTKDNPTSTNNWAMLDVSNNTPTA